MKNRLCLLAFLLMTLIACKDEHGGLNDGLYAEIETSKGTIITSLNFEKAPVTVANFVTLAEGKNTYVNQNYKDKKFFDGLTFHRVIKGFMIQGGDPDANGSGGPGYKFKDEFSDLTHDRAGTLSMANAGPGTNGSQFFITHVPTPDLDGKHTVFGYVIGNGMEVVNAIEIGDVINSVTIIRKGEAAKKFDALKVFQDYVMTDEENQKKKAAVDAETKRLYDQQYKAVKAQKAESFSDLKTTAKKTPSGLQYVITRKGTGKKPAAGTTIYIDYAGYLENGEMFDSSLETVAKVFGKYDERRAQAKMYTPIPFQAGRKDGLIPGFIEGIEKMSIGDKAVIFIPSNLGYGPQGAGNIIPPDANLIFELEMSDKAPEKK